MKTDWVNRALLGVVALLLALNLLRPLSPPAFAFRPQDETAGIIRLDGSRALLYYRDEVVLVGAKRLFDQPFENYQVEVLARESLIE